MSRNGNREKCRDIYNMCHDAEKTDVTTQEFDMARSKIFRFHTVRLVISSKLKTKIYQRTETCEHNIDIGTDGNLMSSTLYKAL